MRIPKTLYVCRGGDGGLMLDDMIGTCKWLGTEEQCTGCRGEVIFKANGDRKPKKKKKR